jgi:transposase
MDKNNTNKTNKTNVRSKYTQQFKDQAVDRAIKDGVRVVANDLGIAESQLYAWRAKRHQGDSPLENQKLQQAEFARLKRENARLEQENSFLKKAAAYFARDDK